MIDLLVVIDRSLEASFALRTACLFGTDVNIRPIYVFDPPGHHMLSWLVNEASLSKTS